MTDQSRVNERTWEVRLVKQGEVVRPDEEFSPMTGAHHAKYRVGFAVKEVRNAREDPAR